MFGAFQQPTRDVLICEDHPFIQAGLEISIREVISNLRSLYFANTGKDALYLVQEHQPDVAIIDLGLPDIPGTDLIPQLKQLHPKIKIVVLTSCDNPVVLEQTKKMDVSGIALKTSPLGYLREILAQIDQTGGRTLLDPAVRSLLQKQENIEFTPREFEVLQGIVQGKSNQEIADDLGCALTTIRFHRANIMDKTDIRNAAELTAWFLQGQRKRN